MPFGIFAIMVMALMINLKQFLYSMRVIALRESPFSNDIASVKLNTAKYSKVNDKAK